MQVWTLPYVNVARSYLRRAGVTRLVAAPARVRNRLRRAWYGLSTPQSVDANVNGARAKLLVADATEYVRALSYRDDHAILTALLGTLVRGDVYWDIGASIGLYTTLVASHVGPDGQVVAFEPEPRSNARLRENIRENGCTNVRVFDVALGREPATMHLHFAGHFTSGTHTLFATGATAHSTETVPVRVLRGDDLRTEERLRPPKTIKIDVEGAEEDVISGLSSTLGDASCRAVLCEVHFALLEARGHRDAAQSIVHSLGSLGFHRTRWIDPSHLLATK